MKKAKERVLPAGVVTTIFAVVLISSFFSAPFAAAQEEKLKQETAQSEKATGEYELETMTVTSQKREEDIQDVPMSVSVFSDIQIEDADIRDTVELTRFTPNVYMKQVVPDNIVVIRGITSFDPSLSSPVGFYVDDVNFPIHYMHNPDLFDIERVEVLKGPQGTLYGRNSESGVINIITKQPDDELRGKIFGEYNSYDTEHGSSPGYRAGGSISGPMVKDKLYLGLAGQWEDSDGFMKNIYNDDDEAGKIDHLNGRGILRWTPTDKWDISFIGDVMGADDGKGYYKYFSGPSKTDRHEINYDGEYYLDQKGDGQTVRVKYEGDAFNLLSVTALRYSETKNGGDVDCTPFDIYGNNIFKAENDLLSEEIRMFSPNKSGPFKWLIGLYGFEEETDVGYKHEALMENRKTDIEIEGYAIFSQSTYTLFDRLHLTAGLRYDHQNSEGEQKYDYMDMWTMSPQSKKYDKDLDYDEWLPKLAIAYDFTDDIMAYASASKGYLAGGYNYFFGTGLENFTYDSEYTWNYEMGTKTSWLDNRLMANLSLFYIDMEDKQVIEWVGGTIQKIENAAEAHSMGVELELQARLMQGLDLFAGFGYMEAEFDDWTATEVVGYNPDWSPIMGTYNYEGKDLPNAPEYTYNIGVQYRHLSGFFGRVDLLGTGDIYGDAKNKTKVDAYQLVNLRLGYEREDFDIIFWCKNLFDEDYEAWKMAWGADEFGIEGEPRMFGATVTYRF